MYTVALVDDHILVAEAITAVINTFNNFCVTCKCKNGREFLDLIKSSGKIPDIVLLDLNMPVLNGYKTMKILQSKYPEIPILILSSSYEHEDIDYILRLGARGCLNKKIDKKILEKALKDVVRKGFYRNTCSELYGRKPIDSKIKLKNRELEFIKYACTELTYKEIAKKMFISPRTVDGIRDSLYTKLALKNRIGLVIYAIRHKLYIP